MPEPWRAPVAAIPLALAMMFATTPAAAHKINLFAHVEGHTIQGQAYARGGDPVRQAMITALGPGGERLGEATTDDEGNFVLTAKTRCDHRLMLDAGPGHIAEFTIPADELPNDLAARPDDVDSMPPVTSPTTPPDAPASTFLAVDHEALTAQLASIDRQIVQLRKQIDGYEQKTRLHDVIGGLGYILGLMGLAYYFLGSRGKQTRP